MSSFNVSSNPVPSINFRSDSANSTLIAQQRVDSNSVLFFENELNYVDPKEFETVKNDLNWLKVFSVRSLDAGLESYTYRVYDGYGNSKFTANKAKDIPIVSIGVSIGGEQFSSSIANADCSLEFTAQDLLASSVAKKEIVSRLRRQAIRSNFELMNKACFEGYKPLGIPGLMSNIHIDNKKPVAAVKTNKTAWADKTPEEILSDIMEGYNSVLEKTSDNITPDTLLISSAAYDHIATKIYNTFNGNSILQQVVNMTDVKVQKVRELNKKFQGDTNGFVFFKNDSEYVEQMVPSLFNMSSLQLSGWNYTVYCRSRYGGLVIRQPQMFAFRYGI